FLEEKLHTLGQPVDDAVLAGVNLRHVDRGLTGLDGRASERDPPLLGALQNFQRVRVLEERLGGNTAPDEAGSAERLLRLDDSHLKAKLRGADGCHIAACSGPNHNNVEFAAHFFSEDRGTKVVVDEVG